MPLAAGLLGQRSARLLTTLLVVQSLKLATSGVTRVQLSVDVPPFVAGGVAIVANSTYPLFGIVTCSNGQLTASVSEIFAIGSETLHVQLEENSNKPDQFFVLPNSNESLQKEGTLSMYDIVIVADQGQNEAWTVTTVIIDLSATTEKPPVTCMAYSGGLCSAVFVSDPVNISNQGSAFLTVANTTTYGQIFEGFQLFYGNSIYSQSCLEYLRFLLCLYLYKACPGYVWCGPYPKDALKDAVANTCGCTDTYSCIIINFLNASSVIEKGYFEGSSSTGLVGGGESQCRDIVTGLQCPPVCTHQYCSKRANRTKVCSLPGFGSCTGACKVSSCRACYYNDSPREIPSGCQRHQCNGLTERPLNKCLSKWGKCIRKQYMMLYSKDQDKQERFTSQTFRFRNAKLMSSARHATSKCN